MNGLIVVAVEQRRLLKLAYSQGNRIVEPHVYGLDGGGRELLRCYQLAGESTSGERAGWKLLRAADIAIGVRERLDGGQRHSLYHVC